MAPGQSCPSMQSPIAQMARLPMLSGIFTTPMGIQALRPVVTVAPADLPFFHGASPPVESVSNEKRVGASEEKKVGASEEKKVGASEEKRVKTEEERGKESEEKKAKESEEKIAASAKIEKVMKAMESVFEKTCASFVLSDKSIELIRYHFLCASNTVRTSPDDSLHLLDKVNSYLLKSLTEYIHKLEEQIAKEQQQGHVEESKSIPVLVEVRRQCAAALAEEEAVEKELVDVHAFVQGAKECVREKEKEERLSGAEDELKEASEIDPLPSVIQKEESTLCGVVESDPEPLLLPHTFSIAPRTPSLFPPRLFRKHALKEHLCKEDSILVLPSFTPFVSARSLTLLSGKCNARSVKRDNTERNGVFITIQQGLGECRREVSRTLATAAIDCSLTVCISRVDTPPCFRGEREDASWERMKGQSVRVPYSSKWEREKTSFRLTEEQKAVVNQICYERERQLNAKSGCVVVMGDENAGLGKELAVVIFEQWLLWSWAVGVTRRGKKKCLFLSERPSLYSYCRQILQTHGITGIPARLS